MMQNDSKKTKKLWIIGVVSTLIIICVVIAIAIISKTANIESSSNIKLEFDVDTSIPKEELEKVCEYLSGVIRDNTDDFDESATYYGIVRNYKESGVKNGTANFIVDFDDIKQSYAVSVSWPSLDDGSPNIVISCPILDSKYPEAECITEANSSTEIIGYLPHKDWTSSGVEFEVVGNYSNGGLYLSVNVEACGDAEVIEDAIKRTKDWISFRGMNPDDYLFYAPTNLCDKEDYVGDGYFYMSANHATTDDEKVNEKLPYFVPNMYNIYPITDFVGNVISIKAEISGCTEFQTEPMEEQVNEYLETNGIFYPVEFEYCVEQNL